MVNLQKTVQDINRDLCAGAKSQRSNITKVSMEECE